MSTKKIVIVVVIVLALAGVIAGTILYGQSGIIKVATSRAMREDLVSSVSGTGQIKPKTYVNVGATAFGRITHLYVKEGDHVKAGELIATVESQQPASQVEAQQATIDASRTTVGMLAPLTICRDALVSGFIVATISTIWKRAWCAVMMAFCPVMSTIGMAPRWA